VDAARVVTGSGAPSGALTGAGRGILNVSTRCKSSAMTRAKESRLDREALAAVLGKQHEVVSWRQVLACGMTRDMLSRRSRPEGQWQRLLPGVYLTVTGTPTTDQRDMAALLYAGPGAVITGPAALRRFGLRAPRADAVDVLVPALRRRQSSGFVTVHRTTKLPPLACIRDGIQFALAARAVADAARGLTGLAEVRAVVAGAVQRRLCTLAQLIVELDSGPVRGSALLREALTEVGDGIRSAAEADLRDLIMRARLPMPMFNARLCSGGVLIAVTDAWWPDAGVAAEVDSREWHLSPQSWEETMRRHARMTALGILVLHFSPRQIRGEPNEVVAAIRSALRSRAGQRLADVQAAPAAG
jgi:very-short-patch-repair endonuclease